jgi:hypothetical protein
MSSTAGTVVRVETKNSNASMRNSELRAELIESIIDDLRHRGVFAKFVIEPDGEAILFCADKRIRVYAAVTERSPDAYNFRDLDKPHHHSYEYGPRMLERFLGDLADVLKGRNVCWACAAPGTKP